MKAEEYFSAVIAAAVLKSADEDIQAEVLADLVEKTNADSDLESQINDAMKSGKRAGDFGMEIIGPLLIPVLIEAGKELWKLFIKKLGDKATDKLAEFTVEKVKKIAHSIWSGSENSVSVIEYEKLVRKAAKEQELSSEQTEKLILSLKSNNVKELLKNE